jgi:hypothetical protein
MWQVIWNEGIPLNESVIQDLQSLAADFAIEF